MFLVYDVGYLCLFSDGFTSVFIVENGLSMFLWLVHNLNPEFVEEVFGVSSLAQINIETCVLLELDNPRSQRINQIISKVRSQRSHYMKVTIFLLPL